jgi:TRAP-type C4-dicarboxylate transport system substrate-binding protein
MNLRFARLGEIALLGVAMLLAGAAPARAAQRSGQAARVKLGTLLPRGTAIHIILQKMAEKWRQAPEGGVALTIYTDGTMGSEADMVRRMRVGQLQAATLTAAGLAEIDSSVGALQKMPLAYRTLDEAEHVRARLQPMLEKKLLEKGFVVLQWGDAGWVRFFSREPALRPDDFKRMKIFVGADDPAQVDLTRAAGYQAVPLEWSDALTSLQTGMIDALPTIPMHALAGQFYGVARHMLEVDWAPIVGATVMTRRAWDALPPATQQAILQAAREAGEEMTRRSRAESLEAVEAMRRRGLSVHALTPELEAEWRRFAETLYPKIRGSIVPADIFDEVQRLLAEYRAQRAGGKK